MKEFDISLVHDLDLYWKDALGGNAESQYMAGIYLLHHAKNAAHCDKESCLDMAFEMLMNAARQEDPDACYEVGISYMNGCGCPADENKAIEWLAKAFDLGETNAALYIATIYGCSTEGMADFSLCRTWIEKAKAAGNPDAMAYLAMMYLDPTFKEYNEEKGMAILMDEANWGPMAHRELGYMYMEGKRVGQDTLTAFKHFEEGYYLGDLTCLYEWALCYLNGIGTEVDEEAALSLMFTAAKEDQPDALKWIIEYYMKYTDDPEKFNVALYYSYCEQQAGCGNHFLQLAACYENPDFKVFDYNKAAEAYRNADLTIPEVNYRMALLELADDYADSEFCLKALARAAERGLEKAHELMAYIYSEPSFSEHDDVKAAYHTALAITQPGSAFKDVLEISWRKARVSNDYHRVGLWLERYMRAAGLDDCEEAQAIIQEAREAELIYGVLPVGFVIQTPDGQQLTISDYEGERCGNHFYTVKRDAEDKRYTLLEAVPMDSCGRKLKEGGLDEKEQAHIESKRNYFHSIFTPFIKNSLVDSDAYLHCYQIFETNNTVYALCDYMTLDFKDNKNELAFYYKIYEWDGDKIKCGIFDEGMVIQYGIRFCKLLEPYHQTGRAYGFLDHQSILMTKKLSPRLPNFNFNRLMNWRRTDDVVPTDLTTDLQKLATLLKSMLWHTPSREFGELLSRICEGGETMQNLQQVKEALQSLSDPLDEYIQRGFETGVWEYPLETK